MDRYVDRLHIHLTLPYFPAPARYFHQKSPAVLTLLMPTRTGSIPHPYRSHIEAATSGTSSVPDDHIPAHDFPYRQMESPEVPPSVPPKHPFLAAAPASSHENSGTPYDSHAHSQIHSQ